MHSRLAFSIATAVDPDILIIDEALAAGDVMFVQKCLRRIRELCSGGRTVLLVSHGTGLLAQLCQRVIWIDKGALRMEGSALSVVQAYDVAAHQGADSASWVETIEPSLAPQAETDQPTPNLASANDPLPPLGSQGNGKQIFRRGPILIEKIELLGADSEPTVRLTTLLPFTLRIHYVCEGPLPNESLGIALAINQEHDLAPVIQWYTQNIGPDETRETYAKAPFRIKPFQSGVIDLEFDYTPFRTGDYIMSIGLLPNRPGSWEFYDYRHLFYSFKVHDGGLWMGAPVFFKPTLNHQATIAETQRPVKAAKA